jgi:hypothetical protein
MPRQQAQPGQPPYTKVLSALLKTDLVRLCVELRLPSDGPVVGLRTRLKGYLSRHRATLATNPRFTALFPRHDRPNQQLAPVLPLPHADPPPSVSILSYVDDEFEPWNGINNHDGSDDEQEPVLNQPPDHHEPAIHHDPPSPSPPPGSSLSSSSRGFSPPDIYHADERKSFLHKVIYLLLLRALLRCSYPP